MADWTSNLLVAGVVLVVGLTFGRQLMSWWAADVEPDTEAARDVHRYLQLPRPDEQAAHQLDFGDLPIQMGRQTLAGTRADVFESLRWRCRDGAERNLSSTRVPGPEEQKMLQDTAQLKPVEQEPGRWRIYQLDGPTPMVVATDAPVGSVGTESSQANRVLCWGLALPHAAPPDRWTLFVCVPATGRDRPIDDQPVLPTPPGARRLMSLATADGGTTIVMGGSGEVSGWRAFFDTWFMQHDWTGEDPWQTDANVESRTYLDSDGAFSVQVLIERGDDLRGIMTVARR
jgi:hypothetical protein